MSLSIDAMREAIEVGDLAAVTGLLEDEPDLLTTIIRPGENL